jgi:hypothetical protein
MHRSQKEILLLEGKKIGVLVGSAELSSPSTHRPHLAENFD